MYIHTDMEKCLGHIFKLKGKETQNHRKSCEKYIQNYTH